MSFQLPPIFFPYPNFSLFSQASHMDSMPPLVKEVFEEIITGLFCQPDIPCDQYAEKLKYVLNHTLGASPFPLGAITQWINQFSEEFSVQVLLAMNSLIYEVGLKERCPELTFHDFCRGFAQLHGLLPIEEEYPGFLSMVGCQLTARELSVQTPLLAELVEKFYRSSPDKFAAYVIEARVPIEIKLCAYAKLMAKALKENQTSSLDELLKCLEALQQSQRISADLIAKALLPCAPWLSQRLQSQLILRILHLLKPALTIPLPYKLDKILFYALENSTIEIFWQQLKVFEEYWNQSNQIKAYICQANEILTKDFSIIQRLDPAFMASLNAADKWNGSSPPPYTPIRYAYVLVKSQLALASQTYDIKELRQMVSTLLVQFPCYKRTENNADMRRQVIQVILECTSICFAALHPILAEFFNNFGHGDAKGIFYLPLIKKLYQIHSTDSILFAVNLFIAGKEENEDEFRNLALDLLSQIKRNPEYLKSFLKLSSAVSKRSEPQFIKLLETWFEMFLITSDLNAEWVSHGAQFMQISPSLTEGFLNHLRHIYKESRQRFWKLAKELAKEKIMPYPFKECVDCYHAERGNEQACVELLKVLSVTSIPLYQEIMFDLLERVSNPADVAEKMFLTLSNPPAAANFLDCCIQRQILPHPDTPWSAYMSQVAAKEPDKIMEIYTLGKTKGYWRKQHTEKTSPWLMALLVKLYQAGEKESRDLADRMAEDLCLSVSATVTSEAKETEFIQLCDFLKNSPCDNHFYQALYRVITIFPHTTTIDSNAFVSLVMACIDRTLREKDNVQQVCNVLKQDLLLDLLRQVPLQHMELMHALLIQVNGDQRKGHTALSDKKEVFIYCLSLDILENPPNDIPFLYNLYKCTVSLYVASKGIARETFAAALLNIIHSRPIQHDPEIKIQLLSMLAEEMIPNNASLPNIDLDKVNDNLSSEECLYLEFIGKRIFTKDDKLEFRGARWNILVMNMLLRAISPSHNLFRSSRLIFQRLFEYALLTNDALTMQWRTCFYEIFAAVVGRAKAYPTIRDALEVAYEKDDFDYNLLHPNHPFLQKQDLLILIRALVCTPTVGRLITAGELLVSYAKTPSHNMKPSEMQRIYLFIIHHLMDASLIHFQNNSKSNVRLCIVAIRRLLNEKNDMVTTHIPLIHTFQRCIIQYAFCESEEITRIGYLLNIFTTNLMQEYFETEISPQAISNYESTPTFVCLSNIRKAWNLPLSCHFAFILENFIVGYIEVNGYKRTSKKNLPEKVCAELIIPCLPYQSNYWNEIYPALEFWSWFVSCEDEAILIKALADKVTPKSSLTAKIYMYFIGSRISHFIERNKDQFKIIDAVILAFHNSQRNYPQELQSEHLAITKFLLHKGGFSYSE